MNELSFLEMLGLYSILSILVIGGVCVFVKSDDHRNPPDA